MDKVKVGILGYGGFGQFLHRSWMDLNEIEVVAVADERLVDTPEQVRDYKDYRELANDPEVDVVAVVTPPSTHVALASELMRAGKHLLLEKPAALSLEQGESLLAVRDNAGVHVAINHMLRFHPLLLEFQRWVGEDYFGPLRHASVENYAQDEDLPPGHWFWDESLSGGILIEHAVHFIDLVGLLTDGRVTRVNGSAAERPTGQRDRVLATVEYDNGLIATHFHQFSGLKSFEETHIRLAFDSMRMRLHGWIPLSGHIHALVNDDSLSALRTLPNWNEARLISLNEGRETSFKTTGEERSATHEVFGSFRMDADKGTVYADCVRASILDVAKAVRDPNHRLRVPLEAGVEAVRIAEMATVSAR